MSLQGKRVIVSRAKEQAGSLSNLLQEKGAEVLEIPFIEIHPAQSYEALDKAIENLLAYDWLILTSVNGVSALFSRLEKQGKSEADLLHLKIVAIGPATRKAIEKHGIPVDIMPKEYVAEAVVEEMRGQVKGERVLLVRAKVARDVIPNALRDLGAKVHVMEAYETIVPETSRTAIMEALKSTHKPWAITFTSSSTVKNFVELVGEENAHSNLLDGVKLASIGPVTSGTLRELGLRVDIEAKEYTIPGLVEAMAKAH
ncbi:MAG TPA: uroporphyrinogen-III synthase [Terriglobales bacterium]|nr:uroporphyrinogen-III synthase [Terriglobales bacterium]